MAKRRRAKKSSFLDDVIDLLALLPWWICLALAAVSFIYLRSLASEPLLTSGQAIDVARHALINAFFKVAQYLVPVICLAAAGMGYFARAHRRALLEDVRAASAVNALECMSWREFEMLVGEAFRRQGFTVVELGGDGPDGGVDLVLKKNGGNHFVQCKQWKSVSVGVDIVRQHFGVMAAHGAAGGMVVTSGRFTQAAVDFAKGRVGLIDGPELFRLIQSVHSTAKPPEGRERSMEAPSGPPLPSEHDAPRCPHCDGPMTLRTARKGASAGSSFWGCRNFPSCRGVVKAGK